MNNRISNLESRLNNEFTTLQDTIRSLTQQISQINVQRVQELEWPREDFPPLRRTISNFGNLNQNPNNDRRFDDVPVNIFEHILILM